MVTALMYSISNINSNDYNNYNSNNILTRILLLRTRVNNILNELLFN